MMRAWPVLAFCGFLLAACGCSCPPPTVVVPQGASVVCPSGSAAIVTSSGYRC
jgi:hypothetical protein